MMQNCGFLRPDRRGSQPQNTHYADVYLWAGKNGDGDVRLRTTGVIVAT